MADTNYFSGIVKILEPPKQRFLKPKFPITLVRVEVSQIRGNKIILLWFWGNLAREVKKYYQVNDYILIEGYLSIRNQKKKTLSKRKRKKLVITVFKTYPFFLKSIRTNNKVSNQISK